MKKQGISLLATYLNWDEADVKEHEYQYGQYTQKVFSIYEDYYCPYRTRPVSEYDGFLKEHWVKVENLPFPYENSVLWKYLAPED